MLKTVALALLALPLSLHAAGLDSKYEQARRIAVRDPKVRAAYAAADRKLAAKIAELDPALKGYKPGQPAPKATPRPVAKARPTPKPKPVVKPAPKPTPRPVVKAKPTPTPKPVVKPKPTPKPTPRPKVRGSRHKVAPGETFESIAMRYRLGVPTLRQANPGVQPRSLRAGDVIIVPEKNTAPPVSQGIPYRKPQPKPTS